MAQALVAPLEEHSLYTGHVQELNRVRALVASGAPVGALAPVVSAERRAFGWSFLPGAHGSRVESAFHAFASFVEHGGPTENHGA
jgi:hypothetical protein